MQKENDWKASQLVFLADWAFFRTVTKTIGTAAKEAFFKALDNPCKKLNDLSVVLCKAFDDIGAMVSTSELSQLVRNEQI